MCVGSMLLFAQMAGEPGQGLSSLGSGKATISCCLLRLHVKWKGHRLQVEQLAMYRRAWQFAISCIIQDLRCSPDQPLQLSRRSQRIRRRYILLHQQRLKLLEPLDKVCCLACLYVLLHTSCCVFSQIMAHHGDCAGASAFPTD